MKGRKYALFVSALLISAVGLFAQEKGGTTGGAFSLQQAIEYSFKNSLLVRNAELDMQSAYEKRKEVIGTGLPQISGSIDVKDYLAIPTSLLPGDFFGRPGTYVPVKFGVQYNATAGFSAQQLLFSNDYVFGVKAQKAFLELSRIGMDRSKSEASAQVTKAYYNVLIARARVKTLEANITRLQKMYEDTKAANAQGLTELLDVQRLELQYVNLQTDFEKTQRLIGLAEAALKFQMGYPQDQSIELSDSLRLDPSWTPEMTTGNPDVSRKPEVLMAVATQSLRALDYKRNKWSYLPTLAAYGSYQWNAQRSSFNFLEFDGSDPLKQWFNVGLIGVTLNVNIFTGMQRVAKTEQAKLQMMQATNNVAYAKMGSDLEARKANIDYINAYSTLERQKKNMELAQQVLDVSIKKYEAGVGNNLDVVVAQAAYTEAQTNFYASVFDLVVARTDYQRATGTILK